MRFVAFIALVLLTVPALALDKPAVSDPNPSCRCASCECPDCLCGKVVAMPNGRALHFAKTPGPVVDTHNAWPWQGPFRWAGAIARAAAGAQPRFR